MVFMNKWKNVFVLAFILLGPFTGNAQKAVVSVAQNNFVYCGLDNILDVLVENVSFKHVILSTDSGTVWRDPEYNYWWVRPEHEGQFVVKVKKLVGKKEVVVDSVVLRAKAIPDPVAVMGTKNGGEIRANELRPQLGLNIVLRAGLGIEARYVALSFTCIIKHKEGRVFIHDCIGPKFDEAIKNEFLSTCGGDVMVICQIKEKGPDGKIKQIAPVEFQITE